MKALHLENILHTYFDAIRHFKNFLELSEVEKIMKNPLFSSFWASKSPLSLASNLKKSHVDTFVCIETVWNIVWSRQSLLHVPMDLNMCLTSYFGFFNALEIFFRSPKYQTVIYKITIFLWSSTLIFALRMILRVLSLKITQ